MGALRVISVTSGKGGVGKSHLAANVATVAAQGGARVVLIDASGGLSSVEQLFGVPAGASLVELLDGAGLDDVLVPTPQGPHLLSSGRGERRLARLSEQDRLSLVAAWQTLAERFDVIVVDAAPGVQDDVLFFSALACRVALVVTNEPTSLNDAVVLARALKTNTAVRTVDVVVSLARNERGAGVVFGKFAQALEPELGLRLRFAGHVPEDHNVRRATAMQRPLVSLAPLSPASRAFNRLAQQLLTDDGVVAAGAAIGVERVLLERLG